ncbi:hypothetical protein CASFOL_042198 [Castilleja foliolosa]|uniref:Cytochrome P450 n=1 Tax=Castilleja foliolosa TaxID=1961234 RepID=A0ABD3BA36_9LAMI
MWYFAQFVIAFVIIYLTYWIYKWRNPKCNGILPPGSSGIPLIGETLELFIPTNSNNDLHPFIKKRLQRHGPLFRTNLAGRNVVVSADHEFNRFIFGQEEKSVVMWYLDSFGEIIEQGGFSADSLTIYKYKRNLVSSHFGIDCIRQKLLSQFEERVRKTLHSWATKDSIELEYAYLLMQGEFALTHLCSYDPHTSKELIDNFVNGAKAAFSFPLKIPGTTYYNGLKKKEKVLEKINEMVSVRLASSQNAPDDLLGQMIKDMSDVTFVTKEYIYRLIFTLMFAMFQSVPFTITVALKFLSENPDVLQELTAEHEEILRKRQTQDSSVTWEEFKSMTFTQQVINETMRLGSSFPGFLRKVVKDIKVNGYTIPAGWGLLASHRAMHLDPELYNDPLKFNPSRWKDVGPEFMAKNFKPFGGGIKQCPGADFTRASMALFLHVLVTKYRWSVVKGGEIVQDPTARFKNGLHINLSERQD